MGSKTLYRGSVKDLLGPVALPVTGRGTVDSLIFEYSDAYSVFDWGRMPDALARKGEALSILAAHWFEKLEAPDGWKRLVSGPEAASFLAEASRFESSARSPWARRAADLGERLARSGLPTHYLGLLGKGEALERLSEVKAPSRRLAVRRVEVARPRFERVLGREVPDYGPTREARSPKLIPLEFVFRFSCPAGSSLEERLCNDPAYLAERGFEDRKPGPGTRWAFPTIELFTKLEPSDRSVGYAEALAISGLAAPRLEEALLLSAWVALWLREDCGRVGLELADGKLEWALEVNPKGSGANGGEVILVDAIGPDELRLLVGEVPLSKEFLRACHRATPWYDRVTEAKKRAGAQGVADWKSGVGAGPEPLGARARETAEQLYPSLANAITGRDWFPGAWPLEQLAAWVAEVPR